MQTISFFQNMAQCKHPEESIENISIQSELSAFEDTMVKNFLQIIKGSPISRLSSSVYVKTGQCWMYRRVSERLHVGHE